jgi:succinyl-CoA synthetase beta subunit
VSDRVAKWLSGLRSPGRPDEYEAKELLRLHGIAAPGGVRVFPGDAAGRIELRAPYAVKVCSPDILHKTEHGGVRLGVRSEELTDVVSEMRRAFPNEAVLVEEMTPFAQPEFIVGALVDEEFGPAVMVGAGGVLTELYRDVTFRLAPCEEKDALQMLDELRIGPLFKGYRGMESLDGRGLAGAICAAGRIAVDLGERFSQLDVNPIAFADGRWTALDAKLVLKG